MRRWLIFSGAIMTTKTDTEQLRAEFEAWTDNHYYLSELNNIYLDDDYVDPEMQAAWEGYQAGRAALQSQEQEEEHCTWHNDPETDNSWDTSCRQLFEIYDGTPTDNGMRFCCYCGKPIRQAIDHARRIEESK